MPSKTTKDANASQTIKPKVNRKQKRKQELALIEDGLEQVRTEERLGGFVFFEISNYKSIDKVHTL